MYSDNCDRYFRPWSTKMDTPTSASPSVDETITKTDCPSYTNVQANKRSPSPIISEDFPSTGNLDRLSNFVMNATQESHSNSCSQSAEKREQFDNPTSSNAENSSSSSDASCESTSPPSVLFASLPASSPDSYWLSMANNSAIAQDRLSYNYTEFYRQFSSLQVSSNYLQNVEEAVKLLQEQDAAKQMKKFRPKKFRCEYCNVAFSNNGQLKGHVRIHTGERPFKCDFENCGKSFTRNEELTRHKRIHTGDRPHQCHFCTKRFGRKDHLKKHAKTHFLRSGPSGFDESTSAFNIFRRQSFLPMVASLPTLPPPSFPPPTMMPLSSSLMPSSLQPSFFPIPPSIIPASSFQPPLPITSAPITPVPKTSESSLFLESPIVLPSELSSLPSPNHSAMPEPPSPRHSLSSPPSTECARDYQVNRSTIDVPNRPIQWTW